MRCLWQTRLGAEVWFNAQRHRSEQNEIASFFSESPGTVVDNGCGSGRIGNLIEKKFPGTPVIGIELNRHAAEHARQHLELVISKNIDTLALAAHIESTCIDIVLLLDVREYLPREIRSWMHSLPLSMVIPGWPGDARTMFVCYAQMNGFGGVIPDVHATWESARTPITEA